MTTAGRFGWIVCYLYVTATALRLAKFFGNSEGFWMNLQLRWDLYHAKKSEERELRQIRTMSV